MLVAADINHLEAILWHEIPVPDNQNLLAGSHLQYEVLLLTSLASVICCWNSTFGHVARLVEDTAAHQALRCHIDQSVTLLGEAGDVAEDVPEADVLTDFVWTTTSPAGLWR